MKKQATKPNNAKKLVTEPVTEVVVAQEEEQVRVKEENKIKDCPTPEQIFSDNKAALMKFYHLKKFSTLTDEQAIAWIIRNNIK